MREYKQKDKEELEIQGCRKFVCPNISLIDVKGKELLLKEGTIKKAKELAMKYFKDTYHRPHYASAKHLLPSFVCVAAIMEGDKRFQKQIADVFGTTNVTIKKWNRDIVETMGLDKVCNGLIIDSVGVVSIRSRRGPGKGKRRLKRNYISMHQLVQPDLDLIEKGGKILGSDANIIKKAKELATKYFNNVLLGEYIFPETKTIIPSLFYLASILENERRSQMEIGMKFNVAESHVSFWFNNIKEVLGIKIICGFDRRVLKVIEVNS